VTVYTHECCVYYCLAIFKQGHTPYHKETNLLYTIIAYHKAYSDISATHMHQEYSEML